MGSKRKIAKPLIDYMLNSNPNAKYFYDLFGGGGSMSFEALKRKRFETVHYNELNTGVVKLLEKIREDGVNNYFYKWVDRETFNNHKNDNDWYGGLLATCWSFGNNKDKGYLFGANIEENKRLLHEIIVNRCNVSKKQFEELTGLYIDDFYLKDDNLHKRRLSVMGVLSKINGRGDLESLQNLQQLQNLESLQNLHISNKSYDDVIITTPIEETIIYLDPPYKSTSKYSKDIDHDIFLQFVKDSPYKIYVSSYDFDLPCVFELSHKSSLSATNNSKKVVEKLFCNREELTKGSLF